MKILQLIPVFLFCYTLSAAQHMQVDGKSLMDASGSKITLRGANYPIMDDGSVDLNNPASYTGKIDEYVKTGANAIRIPWNTNGVHWRDNPASGGTAGTMQGYISNGKLAALIDYCFQKNLTVVLEIHDITCQNNWQDFDNIVSAFWLNPQVLQLIQSHASGLILNVVNEFGYDADWGGDLNLFKSNYLDAITTLRNAGIQVPIMIDAPNCGMASSSLVAIANDLLAADDNLIFSVHTYWTAYAASNPLIDAKMQEMQNSAGCFVFGEIANKQDVGSCGDTDITSIYQRVLSNACAMDIGWLAWSYNVDCSPAREMTHDGSFAGLTPYGTDLVHNPVYGLKSPGPCSGSTSVSDLSKNEVDAAIYPNPCKGVFFLKADRELEQLSVYNIVGVSVAVSHLGNSRFSIAQSGAGVYYVRAVFRDGSCYNATLVCSE